MFFLACVIAYTIFNVIKSRQEKKKQVLEEFEESVPKISRHWAIDIAFVLLGLAALIAGSRLLVTGAVSIAREAGLSEAVIGLTIVAIGTSVPELATSIVAAIKKEPDIAIGNVVGSNIYNILFILGAASLVKPIQAPDISRIDLFVMLGMSLLFLGRLSGGCRYGERPGSAGTSDGRCGASPLPHSTQRPTDNQDAGGGAGHAGEARGQ